jgi:hypothetical protein
MHMAAQIATRVPIFDSSNREMQPRWSPAYCFEAQPSPSHPAQPALPKRKKADLFRSWPEKRRREEKRGDIPTSHRDAAAAVVGPDALSPSHGHPRPSHQVLAVSPLPLRGRAPRQSRRRQGLLLLIRRFVLRLADGGVRQEDGG